MMKARRLSSAILNGAGKCCLPTVIFLTLCVDIEDPSACSPACSIMSRISTWTTFNMGACRTTNMRMMQQYGFVLPDGNPADRVILASAQVAG